ncbi:DUF881 domain-containing protein [Raineyella sp. LH-20]|uniref:DUF881 domain-containing protein n=1 Tax=Raineyella sp. LH-20 TaxID=3081204 RepID=UPI002953D3BB|nr:DUF881 domain-containing protein [Raineyella sp. LH-20]WOP19769.1 DUF881 domain-containing protein [Raineyella sp. LH-20]
MTEPTLLDMVRIGARRLRTLFARRATRGPRSRRTRRMVVSGTATVAICVLAGYLIGVSGALARGTDLRGGRNTDLISMVQTGSQRNAALAQQVSTTRAEVDRLTNRAGTGVDPAQLADAAQTAQTVPLIGPGVTVVLDDAPASVSPPGVDPDLLVVHQQDIQAVVNALWEGGAEGMMIQGQRVISTTGIKCVGNTVVLQGIPYAPPYRIQAIGDPAILEAALTSSTYVRNYQDYVAAYGLGYQERREDALKLPAYTGGTELSFASAIPSPTATPTPR